MNESLKKGKHVIWQAFTVGSLLLFSLTALAAPANPKLEQVVIGFDGEFGYQGSTSAEAIAAGIQIAVDEINQAGGVLGGRPLTLVTKANHSVPARSIANIKQFAQLPNLVGIFCGRFSPTVLEGLATLHQNKIPLLDPWGAADAITDNGYNPNYAFRLSLRDSWAMPTMLDYAESKKITKVGLILLNTSWGRGNLKAAENHIATHPTQVIVDKHWFNWDDRSFLERYKSLLAKGAQAILLVANANEAAILIKEVASLPKEQRVPLIAHWGVSGGELAKMAGAALHEVDFSVVQTYSFIGQTNPKALQVIAAAKKTFKVDSERQLPSPPGIAHAYDLTHILALAINKAGSTDREKVRDALEQIDSYQGLIKTYAPPFSPTQHEALSLEQVFMAVYDKKDDAIVRIWPEVSKKKRKK
jgi:branched-chain amino acid transport system substrate-binding protein